MSDRSKHRVGGTDSFEARARKASESVRQQLAGEAPDEVGLRRLRRPARRMAVPRVAAAVVLVAGAAVIGPRLVGGTGGLGGGVAYAAGPLRAFSDCDAVLDYFKEHAPDYLIDQATRGGRGVADSAGGAQPMDPQMDVPKTTTGAEDAARGYSTTNVQEAGVDEPDLVKTDGRIIVAVARGKVHLIKARDGVLTKLATLPDTGARNVFLAGDRVLVFSGPGLDGKAPIDRSRTQRNVLTAYDVSTPSKPRLLASLRLDGEVLDARLVGNQVRVATAFAPDLDIVSPYYGPDGGLSEESKKQLQEAVAKSTVDDWLPEYTLTDRTGATVRSGRLVDCPDLSRPGDFSGLDTVAVSSFDITSALQDRHTVGVVAGGQQLYATGTATYVTTTAWSRAAEPTTSIHKFLTSPSGATIYHGSGTVPGALLNQYAMSEFGGVLRVATTISGLRGWVNSRMVSEGVVTVLREQDGALKQVGQVGGLGRQDNESIRAVRFAGNQGYVVTFRQTDPLYVLDLRNPAAPKVTGELKIPGYSGYLHPIGKDLLLGVGQSGRGTVQFSLFDITNPASPRRIDTQDYGWGSAAAEFDPKAFLSWEPRKLVLAPVTSYDGKDTVVSALVMLRADARGLREVGRITPPQSAGEVTRSLIIGNKLYLLSSQGLQSNSLDRGHRLIDRVKL